MDDSNLKMLIMRSWRRGMREMDLLLGPFAEAALPTMSEDERATFAAMLNENDQDLYAWVVAQTRGAPVTPARYADLIVRIAAEAEARMAERRKV